MSAILDLVDQLERDRWGAEFLGYHERAARLRGQLRSATDAINAASNAAAAARDPRPFVGAPKTWAADVDDGDTWWWHVDGSRSVDPVAGGAGRDPIWVAQICAWGWA